MPRDGVGPNTRCPEYGDGKHRFNPVGRSYLGDRWGGGKKQQRFRIQPTKCKCGATSERLNRH